MNPQKIYSCNVTSCIRNLAIKARAPVAAFSIERTCLSAQHSLCLVNVPAKPSNYAPVPRREAQGGSIDNKTGHYLVGSHLVTNFALEEGKI